MFGIWSGRDLAELGQGGCGERVADITGKRSSPALLCGTVSARWLQQIRRASKASNARMAPRRRSSGSASQLGARAAGPASQTILSIMASGGHRDELGSMATIVLLPVRTDRVHHPARIAVRQQGVMPSDKLARLLLVDASQFEVLFCLPDPIGDPGLHLVVGHDAAAGLRVHDR